MTIYLDCEFNGHLGEFISIGMVSDKGREFYGYVELKEYLPWVKENVVPLLGLDGMKPDVLDTLRPEVCLYLAMHDGEDIVCDSPADIRYLCELIMFMDDSGYNQLGRRLTFKYIPTISYVSKFQHHALWDAKAIMEACNGGAS